jgi:iron(III) transport system permease protein
VAASAGLAVLAAAALAAPLGTLIAWTARGGGSADWGAALGSLVAATAAAAAAAAAAIPVAALVTRHRGGRWVERVAYAVFALPHIAVALGVVLIAARYLGGLYQSLTLLVLVYASLFLAQALGSTSAAMQRVDPALEEASRGLGHGRFATFRRVTLPLVRPGLAAGAALVFVTTLKELPATLILRPTGFDTLAVRIWSAADELRYAAAAAPALLLVAVSAIPLYMLTTRAAR